MAGTLRRIEINFPEPVEITEHQQRALDAIVSEICKAYVAAHPGRIMWPAGIGSKITYMPMTAEEEKTRGIEFSDDTFEIDCAERADYKWRCSKCGLEQGDHKDCIIDPPAGGCGFDPLVKPQSVTA